MDQPTLTCRDERRRPAVRRTPLNGIDYVEIVDDQKQTELCVHLFRCGTASAAEAVAHQVVTPPEDLDAANVCIEGGRRIRNIRVTKVVWGQAEGEDCLRVTVDQPGDFSLYTLRLVEAKEGRPTDKPLRGFDPRYAKAQFSFKVGCPSTLDCRAEAVCPPPQRDEPEINYLVKDYASFRQLILDRLALLMPEWRERHVPDIGITLVELLAYVGDYLSYYQDAVATEAYLDTARQRISVRRHARLVDYHMHEGSSARAWVCVETDQDVLDGEIKLRDVYFTTLAADERPEVFEPLAEQPDALLNLYAAHSTINFYTWGDEQQFPVSVNTQ